MRKITQTKNLQKNLKNTLIKRSITLFILLAVLIFTGCEAGLSSQGDTTGDSFSFSDMYNKLSDLQTQVDNLKAADGNMGTALSDLSAKVELDRNTALASLYSTISDEQTTARTNLHSTISSERAADIDEAFLVAAPPGTIVPFAGLVENIPDGWLLCDGSDLSATTYKALYEAIGTNWGTSGSKFLIPDLRGQFLRGVDHDAGKDPDSAARKKWDGSLWSLVGSYQDDSIKKHNHSNSSAAVVDNGKVDGGGNCKRATRTSANTGENIDGGDETRPRNAYVNYIIKY
ncbi:MAG: tail fiber protein [bacterium]|nr:tail fiber protein [bacterium]